MSMLPLLKKAAIQHRSSFLLLIFVLAALGWSGWGISRASTKRAFQQPDAQPSLGALLKADGTLDLSRGFQGSLNPQGFRLEYAANGAPRFVPAAPTVGEVWDTQFVNANGAQQFAYTVAVIGTDVYLGGSPLATAGNAPVSGLAKWNGSNWSDVSGGVNGAVYALAVSGSDLYVGGSFTTVGGVVAASNIAKWNGSAWSALGTGVSGGGAYVLSLAASGSDVYAGGRFTTAGGNAASNIARWNGSAWSALGSGTDQQVVAVAVSGSNVYAGGDFSTAGSNPANFIARWNGSVWSALGSGMNGSVQSLATSGSDVYAGGPFSTAGGTAANGIARWNGAAWSALGSGLLNASAFPSAVRSILIAGPNLYAAGTIATAGGAPANGIARWNGSAWSALGSGLVSGAFFNSENGLSIAALGSDLYVAGNFSKAGGGEANRIAKWNGSAWSPLGNTSNSVNRNVNVIAINGTDVYVGGEFDFAGGVAAANIAKWNGSTWSALGSGVNSPVFALAVSGTDVYAGGYFITAGGSAANRVARWNGSSWSAMGTGMDGPVNALAVIGTNVYAGGLFSTAGGVSANSIARWNGSAWSALGSGITPFFGDPVSALAVSGTDLYVGGSFTAAGGVSAANIAKWNGSAWSALGSGTNNPVHALAVSGSNLYAGGEFTTAGGTTVNKVAKWNGSAWSAMGTGVSGSGNVLALAATGNDVYAGGGFTTIGGTTANRVAKWNGSAWSALGTGADNAVNALALQGTSLFAGGIFNFAGGTVSHYFGRYGCVGSLTVNNTGDDPDATPGNGVCETATGNGVCTLRAAIAEANALAGCSAMTISFSVTGTINAASILPNITHKSLTIAGPGADQLTVDGLDSTHQIFRAGGTNIVLNISGLTITRGGTSAGGNASAIEFNSSGGQLTVNGCALLNNGGFRQMYSNLSGGITINNSTISGNPTGLGILTDRTPLTFTNSTITGNHGNGIASAPGNVTVTLLNSTVTDGIFLFSGTSGSLTLKNSIIISAITVGSGVSLISQGNNLCSDATLTPTAAGDLINTDPMLSALGNYGGPTPTLALLPGSPAINAGNNTGAPATDQRGIARPQQGTTDIGAFESRGFTMAISGGNNQTGAINNYFPQPLSFTLSSANGEPVNGGLVSFTAPASGASATIYNVPAVITGGVMSQIAAANGIFGGPYNVAASANGANTINFQLTNSGPIISSVVVMRTAGAGSSNSAIAQVSDPNQAANTLAITVNGAASATSNGVTVSGLSIGAGGQVTANVEAAAGATNAQFTLRATNNQNAVATAALLVIVTPPVCDGATTWNSPGRINSESASNDYVGFSVALSGDTALIGAPQDNTAGGSRAGSAYVFTRNGATWTLQQQLTASDGGSNDLFGISVALSGDTALIGAFGDNTPAGGDAGSAYVFTRSGGVWSQQQKLTASDGTDGDGFGVSVALSGDTALIGAYQADTAGGSNAGSAYVFARVGGVWSQQQKLTAPNGMTDDKFGSSVALSGDTALVGAPLADTAGGTEAGSAYVFTRNGAIWTLQQQLTASDSAGSDEFGVSVALSGDTALIGAYGGNSGAGSAYVLTRAGGVWSEQQKLTASDGQFGDRFGVSVALSGDTAIIGADQTSRPSPGSAYVFTRAGNLWSQQQKLLAPDGQGFDNFGISAALSGTTIIVGAPFDDTAGGSDAGSVYIFTSNCNVRPTIAAQTGVARRQGSPLSNSVIATVSDAESVAGSLTVTLTSPSSSNGVTLSNIVNTNGTITADIIADCTATNASFSLQVGDGASTASATLNVAVTPNTAPSVTYANVSVNAGSSTNNVPTAATDNGSITGYAVQSAGSYTGTIIVNSNGIVSISNAAPVGTHTIIVRATDNCGTTTDASFTLTVGNNAPMITAGAALTRQQGSAGSISTIATVNDGETPIGNLVVTATTVPAGITVTSITNASGTVSANVAAACNAAVGANTVVLTVTDANNGTATANLTVNVTANSAPSLSYPISGVALNSATTINPTTATDNGSIASYSIVSVTPPLTTAPTVNTSGVVSVTNAAPFGLHTITVRATDNCGATTDAGFTLNVGCGSLTVTPATLINGLTFVAYSSTLSASGGSGSYTFTLASGTLPAGLSLSGNMISGTPVTAGASTFTIRATDDNGCFGEQSYTLLIGSTGLKYYPLPRPVRLLDTRPGLSPNACFQPNAPIPGNTSRLQPARGVCEGLTIPPTATTITGNITTVQSGGGFLAIYPSDAPQPLVANSNYLPNEIINNSFTVGVGAQDGAVKIYVTSDTDVVIDVTGYYAPPDTGGLYFHPLPRPVRLLETRTGYTGCVATGAPLQGGTNTLQLGTGACAGLTIPPEALALVGNATTVDPQGIGYLTLYPANAAQPLVASSNYATGQIVNGPFTVGLAPNGQFNIFTSKTTELVIDLTGYYSAQANDANGQGLLFTSLGSPLRLLDTRAGQQGCYTPGAPMSSGTIYVQQTQSPCTNLTPTARALIGNATVVNTTSIGYLTFWPADAAQPLVATSNYTAGQIINRYFTVGLAADGSFKRFASSTTELVVDISGFFAP